MSQVFSPNKSSARLLLDFASACWNDESTKAGPDPQRRYLLVWDLYIKARSYMILNRVAFWLAILSGLLVLVWPSIAIVSKDFGLEREFLKSAIVQTTITGIAALMFAVYSHYKKRQMHIENLMRMVVLGSESTELLVSRVLREMVRIDTGFGFSGQVLRKSAEPTPDENAPDGGKTPAAPAGD